MSDKKDSETASLNQLHNARNPHQGDYRRVLTVCSAGLLRSPTAAWVLSQPPYNFNTRAAGIDASHALILVNTVLLSWADEVVTMEPWMAVEIKKRLGQVLGGLGKPVIALDIADVHPYRDHRLVAEIKAQYAAQFKIVEKLRAPTAEQEIV